MAYRVELAARAVRDLDRLWQTIDALDSAQTRAWLDGLERLILTLDEHPARGAIVPEGAMVPEGKPARHLLYGRRRNVYRIIYTIDPRRRVVTVLHIRHGARDALTHGDDT